MPPVHNNLVGAIDQGTSSSRFLVFDSDTEELVAHHQGLHCFILNMMISFLTVDFW